MRALFDKRQLFQDNERTGGRGLDPRSSFIGYVAVSQVKLDRLRGCVTGETDEAWLV